MTLEEGQYVILPQTNGIGLNNIESEEEVHIIENGSLSSIA